MERRKRSSNVTNSNNDESAVAVAEFKLLKAKFYESEIEREGLVTQTEALKMKIQQLNDQMIDNELLERQIDDLTKQKKSLSQGLKDLEDKANKDSQLIVELKTELKKFKELKVEMEGKFLIQQSEIQRLTMKCQEYENLIEENRTEIEKLRKEAEVIFYLERERDDYKQRYEKLGIEFKRFQCKSNENELELETLQSEMKRLKEKCVEFYQKADEDSKTQEILKNEIKVLQHIVGEQDKVIQEKNQQS